jgi:primosomal protein N' (replication factor Y)
MLDADRGLFSPDYQASRKTFLLLYQMVQQYQSIPILIQSFKPEHQAIVQACNKNIQKMKTMESQRREQYAYPPFAQMCVLHYKHEIEHRTVSSTTKLYQELEYLKQSYEYTSLEIRPTPPSIFKKFGKYRYTIVLKGQ